MPNVQQQMVEFTFSFSLLLRAKLKLSTLISLSPKLQLTNFTDSKLMLKIA